jgi:hypothetical protein
MSFLDNLENSLKSLEGRDEQETSREDAAQRRAQTLAVSPWAERLKNSDYVQRLLNQTATASHRLRAKIYLAWLEGALRLEVKGRWCQLTPTHDGIEARYEPLQSGDEQVERIDVDHDDPALLLQRWLQFD